MRRQIQDFTQAYNAALNTMGPLRSALLGRPEGCSYWQVRARNRTRRGTLPPQMQYLSTDTAVARQLTIQTALEPEDSASTTFDVSFQAGMPLIQGDTTLQR